MVVLRSSKGSLVVNSISTEMPTDDSPVDSAPLTALPQRIDLPTR